MKYTKITYKNSSRRTGRCFKLDIDSKRNKKLRLNGRDALNKSTTRSEYFANTLKIKKLNSDEPDSSNLEK